MSIDWGGRRIGLALSDPTQTLARPLAILERPPGDASFSDPDRTVLESLLRVVRDNQVQGIVFGVPYYHLSGDDNPKAPLFLETGKKIGDFLALPCFFSDEGQTSSEALDHRKRRGKARFGPYGGKKSRTDHLAAATLLQRFLDETGPTADRCAGRSERTDPTS